MNWHGLLVSVRDAKEAKEAIEGGAAIVDVKDPAAGSLGRASIQNVVEVARVVCNRLPWTVAAGELRDEIAHPGSILQWVEEIASCLRSDEAGLPGALKIGLHGMFDLHWKSCLRQVMQSLPSSIKRVAVAYVDWDRVGAPHPIDVIGFAREQCDIILFDTSDKDGPGLLGCCSQHDLMQWVSAAHGGHLPVTLAGRLKIDEIQHVSRFQPDVVALRSAVCSNNRLGPVDTDLVRVATKEVHRLEKSIDGTT